MQLLPVLAFALALSTRAEASDPPEPPAASSGGSTERWAGTMAVFGERHIPLLGTISYRTDTFVLSTARREGNDWVVEQATCRVHFPRTAGATVTLDPTAPSKMPISHLTFRAAQDGSFSSEPWASGWNHEDHDLDGNPGITIHVKAPVCGGDLYVESRARSTAFGQPGGQTTLEGDIKIWVEQIMLGVRGPCLSVMTRDTSEWLEGRFAYVRVADGASCESLDPAAWPDPLPDREG